MVRGGSPPDLSSRQAMCGLDLRRRTPAAFDRAVHVALPAEAGVLARKEQSAVGSGEPQTQRRIVRRIEVRVTAPRPGIQFPDDLPRGQERFPGSAEPVERIREALHTVLRDNCLGGLARRSAREHREDAGSPPLLLVPLPPRTDRQIAAERPGAARRSPEPARELKQGLRRRSILEPGNGIVLLSRERGRNRYAPYD